MGSGLAVPLSEGKVHAPVGGTLVSVMRHAFGTRGDTGGEVLAHRGLTMVADNVVSMTWLTGRGEVIKVDSGDDALAAVPGLDTFVAENLALLRTEFGLPGPLAMVR